jgi:hypothetical protein
MHHTLTVLPSGAANTASSRHESAIEIDDEEPSSTSHLSS